MGVLVVIHKDIYESFSPCISAEQYLSTFDDFSQYDYVYLWKEKLEALRYFEVLKAEVENHVDWKVKIMRSHGGGECYVRYD